MKKSIFLFSILAITIFISSCVIDSGGEVVTRRQITIESNLHNFQIGQTNFDSTTVYPYVWLDITGSDSYSKTIRIYPIQDTGFIKLKLFSGRGDFRSDIPLSFNDSLTINTPIDTTTIFIINYSFD